jgi:hypothetical protein
MLTVAHEVARLACTASAGWSGQVVFDEGTLEHGATPTQLGLPTDWSDYGFLVLELRASFSQWFELRIQVGDETRRLRFHPWQGVCVRAAVPLDALRHRATSGHDMASMGNRSRDTYWYGHIGGHGPIGVVDRVSVSIPEPIGDPTLEFRSIALAAEDPGDATLEAGPFVDEHGQWTPSASARHITSIDELRAKWHREDASLQPDDFTVSRFGGCLHRQAEATGFFRVEQVEGRWWFVDPDGCLFFSTGVDCVTPWMSTRVQGREDVFATLPPESTRPPRRWTGESAGASHYASNVARRHGEEWKAAWMDMAIRRMDAWGLNTIANWSDSDLFDLGRKAYTVTTSGWGIGQAPMGFVDVYADDFEESVDAAAARQCAPRKHDPWMLGYFVGNEPPWPGREAQLAEMILSGAETPMRREMRAYLADDDTPGRRRAFLYGAFERFLEAVNGAIRRHDPNHLNLGIRFGGRPPAEIIQLSRSFDVYSQNIYREVPAAEDLDYLYDLTGLPTVIGEFHFGAPEGGLAATLRQTRDQRERGAAYRYYVENGAAHAALIGTHWFAWADQPATGRFDGENYNIGLVDVTDRPYEELVEAMRETHRGLCAIHAGEVGPTDVRALRW